jgi:hypothetical protein
MCRECVIPGTWSYAESPLVDGDLVVVTQGGAEATLLALNKVTRAVNWTYCFRPASLTNQPQHATAMEKAWPYPVVANGRLSSGTEARCGLTTSQGQTKPRVLHSRATHS